MRLSRDRQTDKRTQYDCAFPIILSSCAPSCASRSRVANAPRSRRPRRSVGRAATSPLTAATDSAGTFPANLQGRKFAGPRTSARTLASPSSGGGLSPSAKATRTTVNEDDDILARVTTAKKTSPFLKTKEAAFYL